jgi:hypothetical protein
MSTPPAEKLFCTTIKLPQALQRQFRIYALRKGLTMQKALADMIRATLAACLLLLAPCAAQAEPYGPPAPTGNEVRAVVGYDSRAAHKDAWLACGATVLDLASTGWYSRGRVAARATCSSRTGRSA